jgi:hypothetical protein
VLDIGAFCVGANAEASARDATKTAMVFMIARGEVIKSKSNLNYSSVGERGKTTQELNSSLADVDQVIKAYRYKLRFTEYL